MRKSQIRNSQLLEVIEIETAPNPGASIIWLHGLGADGHDFEPVVPELAAVTAPVRYVFPHAPVRAVTINAGLAMRAWYDIPSLEDGRRERPEDVDESAGQIEALIAREIDRGSAPERIVVAGFSQGAAMALHVGLRYGVALGGIMALSGYLPLSDRLANERSDANAAIPLFMAHGAVDPVLPLALAEKSLMELKSLGYAVEWHCYPGLAHGVGPEEFADLKDWLGKRLPP